MSWPLWFERRLSLKGKAEVCDLHIYSLILYRLLVLPLPSTSIVKVSCSSLSGANRIFRVPGDPSPSLHQKQSRSTESRNATPYDASQVPRSDVRTTQRNLWKEDAFLTLRSVHWMIEREMPVTLKQILFRS